MVRSTWVFLFLTLSCMASIPARGAMIRVDPGGAGDVLTIAAAMPLVTPGDTVAVIEGLVPASNVEVAEGAQVLGGWNASFTGRVPGATHLLCGGGSGFKLTTFQTTATVVDGFEITGATDSAIHLRSSDATITNNEFHGNSGSDGGAIHCEYGASPLIEDNHIHHNVANYGGGVRGHWGYDTSPTIRNNLIEFNQATGAGGGIGVNNGSPLIEGNTVRFNSANNTGGGIHVWHGEGGVVTIRGNLIVYNECATEGGGIGINGGHPVIEGNTIWGNGAPIRGSGISQATSGLPDPGTTQVSNNIIGGSSSAAAISCLDDFAISIDCNCFWDNAGGHFQNVPGSSNDVLMDPRFCDVVTADFHLESASPCAPPGAFGCGLIGALDVGCGPVSIQPSSWADIKAMYR